MATVTVQTFRDAFPQFADPAQWQDPEIQFWIDLGTRLQDPFRWGDIFDYGLMLFVAHNLALGFMSQSASGGGQAPGQVQGVVTSATVDKVSYSRDASSAMDPANGHWNLTTFGLRYVRLIRMVGAGPVQIGVPLGGSNYGYGGAWPGVVYPPGSQ